MIAAQPGLLPEDVLEDLLLNVKSVDMVQVRREIEMEAEKR